MRGHRDYLDFLRVREDYLQVEVAGECNEPEPNESYIKDCEIALAQNAANRAVLVRHNPVEPYGKFCESCSTGRSYDAPESKFPCEQILEITNGLDKVMDNFGYWMTCPHCEFTQWFSALVKAKMYKISEESLTPTHSFIITAGELKASLNVNKES